MLKHVISTKPSNAVETAVSTIGPLTAISAICRCPNGIVDLLSLLSHMFSLMLLRISSHYPVIPYAALSVKFIECPLAPLCYVNIFRVDQYSKIKLAEAQSDQIRFTEIITREVKRFSGHPDERLSQLGQFRAIKEDSNKVRFAALVFESTKLQKDQR
jgi:hypothetical protein